MIFFTVSLSLEANWVANDFESPPPQRVYFTRKHLSRLNENVEKRISILWKDMLKYYAFSYDMEVFVSLTFKSRKKRITFEFVLFCKI